MNKSVKYSPEVGGASGADGAGAPGHAQFTVGGDQVDCREDRVYSRDVTQLGPSART